VGDAGGIIQLVRQSKPDTPSATGPGRKKKDPENKTGEPDEAKAEDEKKRKQNQKVRRKRKC